MTHLKDCAVVTLATGVEATFHNCDADQFEKGELTITDRQTFAERIYPPESWTAYIVYDAQGHYLYACDCDVRVKLVTSYQQPPAA